MSRNSLITKYTKEINQKIQKLTLFSNRVELKSLVSNINNSTLNDTQKKKLFNTINEKLHNSLLMNVTNSITNKTNMNSLKRDNLFKLVDIEYKKLNDQDYYFATGSFGVYFTMNADNGVTVGVKRIDITYKTKFGISKNKEGEEKKRRKKVMREIQILNRLRNTKHSVKIMYYCGNQDKRIYYIVMEHIIGTNLSNIKFPLNESRTKYIATNMAQGLKEMKDVGVTHRDISINNIMILATDDIKFIDFGESCRLKTLSENNVRNNNNNLYQQFGTHQYLSPEGIVIFNNNNNKYNRGYLKQFNDDDFYKRDVWSFGIILHQLLYGDFPECFKSFSTTYFLGMNDILKKGEFNVTYQMAPYNTMSIEAFNLVYSILSKKNPSERPSIEEILLHPFLSTTGGRYIKKPIKKVIKGIKRLIHTGARGGNYYKTNGRNVYIK